MCYGNRRSRYQHSFTGLLFRAHTYVREVSYVGLASVVSVTHQYNTYEQIGKDEGCSRGVHRTVAFNVECLLLGSTDVAKSTFPRSRKSNTCILYPRHVRSREHGKRENLIQKLEGATTTFSCFKLVPLVGSIKLIFQNFKSFRIRLLEVLLGILCFFTLQSIVTVVCTSMKTLPSQNGAIIDAIIGRERFCKDAKITVPANADKLSCENARNSSEFVSEAATSCL